MLPALMMHDDAGAGVGHGRASVLEAAVDMPAHLWYDQSPKTNMLQLRPSCRPLHVLSYLSLLVPQSVNASTVSLRLSRTGVATGWNMKRQISWWVCSITNLRLMARMNKTALPSRQLDGWKILIRRLALKKWGISNFMWCYTCMSYALHFLSV